MNPNKHETPKSKSPEDPRVTILREIEEEYKKKHPEEFDFDDENE